MPEKKQFESDDKVLSQLTDQKSPWHDELINLQRVVDKLNGLTEELVNASTEYVVMKDQILWKCEG